MGNKVKYNLKNVHAAKLKETVSSSGETTYSYENPRYLPVSFFQVLLTGRFDPDSDILPSAAC